MLKNFIRLATRNLIRSRTYSLLNILGLSLGIACILLLGLHVKEELSYDRSFPKHDRIFRVATTQWAKSSPPIAGELIKYFPGINSIARFADNGNNVFHTLGNKTADLKGYYADSSVVKIFDLQPIAGDPFQALSEPGSIVLTRSTATRLFGNTNPIGQKLVYNGSNDQFVKGVIDDLPANTHFHFDYLLPMTTFYKYVAPDGVKSKDWMFGWTYILLNRPEDVTKIRARLHDFWFSYRSDMKKDAAEKDAASARLQPLTDIHLHSDLIQEMEANGSILYVYIFIAVAILIGIIACINFVNLFTTQALKRQKEVAVRKVLGAPRSQLILYFLGEALLLATVSGVIAILLFQGALPFYDDLTGRQVTLSYIFQPVNLLLIIALVASTGLASGLFPALFISGFDPASSLKAAKTPTSPASLLRKGLVVFQFVAAGFLIVSTMLVYRQMKLFRDHQLGFDKDQVADIRFYGDFKDRMISHPDLIRSALLSNPDILSVATAGNTIGDGLSVEGVVPVQKEAGRDYPQVNVLRVDEHYLDVLHIPLAEGRNFSSAYHDSASFIINEAAARFFGLKQTMYAGLINNSEHVQGKIVGVVKDFNFHSLHSGITPLVLEYRPQWGSHLLVRIRAGKTREGIQWLQQKIKAITPSDIFDYSFLDEHIASLYRKEDNMSTILKWFTVFSVLISCLGLFGLAAYAAELRTREIGIRKVIGASTAGLVRLLSLDFLMPVLLGNLLSWPIAWWAVNTWLNEFTYRIPIGWSVFALSLGLTVVVAMLTIGFRCWQTARANPIKSLRSE